MTIRKLANILVLSLTCSIATIYGQAPNKEASPEIVSTGSKLAPRSLITPYHTREEAIYGDAAKSPYALALSDWEQTETDSALTYSATFKRPNNWINRALIFRISGVTSSFSLYCNGQEAGYSQSGIGRTEFDITKLTKEHYNTIKIVIYKNSVAKHIENHRNHDQLTFAEAEVISPPTVFVRDITTAFFDSSEQLSIDVIISSLLLNSKSYNINCELLSPEGQTIAIGQKKLNTSAHSEDTVRFITTIPEPKTWTHETPYLYTIIVKTESEYKVREYVSVRTGLRHISTQDGSITLNGQKVPLTAAEFSYRGSDKQTILELQRLKTRGVNLLIVEGNPQPDIFYTLCDNMGFYVCDQADINTSNESSKVTKGENPSNQPKWAKAYISRAMEAYYSSQSHPSVIMFSPARKSLNGFCLYESYSALKQLEPHRPIIYTEAMEQWNTDDVQFVKYSTADAKPQIIDGGRIKSDNVITIRNHNAFTPLKGTVSFSLKKGRKAKLISERAINIAPGKQSNLIIPVIKNKTGKPQKLEVKVTEEPDTYKYHTPAHTNSAVPASIKNVINVVETFNLEPIPSN